MSETIGLLHPGEMGAAIGAAARAGGARVIWSSAGRGAETRGRAETAGLEDVGSVSALVGASATILSVCPPHAALDVAREVAACGFAGVYVDANAVSPGTAEEVGRVVGKTGATFVDGGIIGRPPRKPGESRLYLSGAGAGAVARWFAGGGFDAVVVPGGPGAASALKMAYAAWTKGTSALIMTIRALARAHGVDDALIREWERSQPDLPARSEKAVHDTARKAWRFVGEMDEIAASLADAGLPDGFYRAAGEIYRRLEGYKDVTEPPAVAEALTRLIDATRVETPPAPRT
jgi:3-hydroxyisobutyrate dehydrogenase-like beta-hydroxyacid dehydrogenase